MGLKQSIVIKCDFTNNQHLGHGQTPGKFATDYIGRDNATETVLPTHDETKMGLDNFVDNYVGRLNATEYAESKNYTNRQLKSDLDAQNSKNGRCFGNDNLSYSSQELYDQGDKIQQLFDQGHTVQKLVFSFTTDYLKERGIIDENYQHRGPGSFRGQVDQMKLRQAINTALGEETKNDNYTNPVWAAAIQVNTNHVHCHAVVADDVPLNKSQRMKTLQRSGKVEEKGEMLAKDKAVFRQSLDRNLLNQKQLHLYHDSVATNRQTTVSLVQQLASREMIPNTQLQAIQNSLPKEKVLWKANSKSPKMKRANQQLDRYIDTMIENYGQEIGYDQAVASVRSYAHFRTKDKQQYQTYVDNGVNQLRTQMKNQVYNTLKHTPIQNTKPQTTYQKYASQNDTELQQIIAHANQTNQKSSDIDVAEFAHRQIAYPSRLQKHQRAVKVYEHQLDRFDEANQNGEVATDAQVMRPMYTNELKYHRDLVDKYRYLLPSDDTKQQQAREKLQPQKQQLQKARAQLVAQGQKEGLFNQNKQVDRNRQAYRVRTAQGLEHKPELSQIDELKTIQTNPEHVLSDKAVAQLNQWSQSQSQYQNVGTQLKADAMQLSKEPSLEFRMMTQDYTNQMSIFTRRSFDDGLLNSDDVVDRVHDYQNILQTMEIPEVPSLESNPQRDEQHFQTTKNKDLDELGCDFTPSMSHHVTQHNVDDFEQTIDSRSQTIDNAVDYTQATGQSNQALLDLQAYVRKQKEIAKKIQATHRLQTEIDTQVEQVNLQNDNTTKNVVDYQTSRDYNEDNLAHFNQIMRTGVIKNRMDSKELD